MMDGGGAPVGWLTHVTPTNVALTVVIGYLAYKVFGLDTLAAKRREAARKKREENLGHDRVFTLEELRQYDGTTPSKEHGGGPYSGFAGRDPTRGLATMAVGLASDEWDDTSDLEEHERQTMLEWKDKFLAKYPARGK